MRLILFHDCQDRGSRPRFDLIWVTWDKRQGNWGERKKVRNEVVKLYDKATYIYKKANEESLIKK